MPLAVSPSPRLPEGGVHVTTHWEAALPLCAAEVKSCMQLRHFVTLCSAVWVPSMEVAGYTLHIPSRHTQPCWGIPMGLLIRQENYCRRMSRAGEWWTNALDGKSAIGYNVQCKCVWIPPRWSALKALGTTCFMREKCQSRCQFYHQATLTQQDLQKGFLGGTNTWGLRETESWHLLRDWLAW